MRIVIQACDHAEQRYPTAGDYWDDEAGNLQVRVSKMGDWRYEALVGVHEVIEALLCRHDGVSFAEIDAFDKEFEEARANSPALTAKGIGGRFFTFRGRKIDIDAEPGDQPDAPYARQHAIATGIERILAVMLGVDWTAYSEAVLALDRVE